MILYLISFDLILSDLMLQSQSPKHRTPARVRQSSFQGKSGLMNPSSDQLHLALADVGREWHGCPTHTCYIWYIYISLLYYACMWYVYIYIYIYILWIGPEQLRVNHTRLYEWKSLTIHWWCCWDPWSPIDLGRPRPSNQVCSMAPIYRSTPRGLTFLQALEPLSFESR